MASPVEVVRITSKVNFPSVIHLNVGQKINQKIKKNDDVQYLCAIGAVWLEIE